jgi:hypothetical protein
MRRHRLARRLIRTVVSLAVVAGLLEITNVVALHMTEDTLAGRAMRATGAHSASVSLSGWPFLYDIVAEGKVDGADVHLTDVPVGHVQVQSLDIRLGQVAMSRRSFLADHALRLTSVSSAAVTAEVTASELSAAAGRTVKLLANGVIEVPDVAGGITAAVQVEPGDEVVVSVDGVAVVHLDLGQDRLVPSCPLQVVVSAGTLKATCTLAPVPASVLTRVDAAA